MSFRPGATIGFSAVDSPRPDGITCPPQWVGTRAPISSHVRESTSKWVDRRIPLENPPLRPGPDEPPDELDAPKVPVSSEVRTNCRRAPLTSSVPDEAVISVGP